MAGEIVKDVRVVPFEEALEKTGFGLYSFLSTTLAGFTIMSYAFVVYGSTLIVPTSACELETSISAQGILAAAPIIAIMLGTIPWGYLGDSRGRRRMLIYSLVSAGLMNCVASLSVNWIMLLIVQFIATLLASGQYSLVMILLSESVPISKRNLVILLVASIFLLSQGTMAVLAIPIIPLTFSIYLPSLGIYWNSWRTLMIVCSIPSLITAIWLYFMQESPKFLMATGDEEGALEVLRKIYRINNRNTSTEFEIKRLAKETQSDDKQTVKEKLAPLLQPPLLRYIIIMTLLFLFQQVGALVVWLPTVANQFMQVLETGADTNLTLCQFLRLDLETIPDPDAVPCGLNNTAMLIVLAVCALQSTVNLVLTLGIGKFGRRYLVIVTTAVCGMSGILINLIPNTFGSAVFYIILLMGVIVLGLYTAISVALFPTNLRAIAMSLAMTGSRIGTFASVQILNWLLEANCDAGFYSYSALFALSAVVAIFLPDDRPKAKAPENNTHKTEEGDVNIRL